MEAQLPTDRKEQTSFLVGKPDTIFFCRHSASTLPTCLANAFLNRLFLLLFIHNIEAGTNWPIESIHVLIETKAWDDTSDQAT